MTPSLLEEIASWKKAGASLKDVVDRLQVRCVPSGYTPTPWLTGILSLSPFYNVVTEYLV